MKSIPQRSDNKWNKEQLCNYVIRKINKNQRNVRQYKIRKSLGI